MGGVGGRGERSAGVSFRTCVRGEISSLATCGTKLKGFSRCVSAEGGGVDWLAGAEGWPQRLSSRAAASLRMSGGISSNMLKFAASSPATVGSCMRNTHKHMSNLSMSTFISH